MKLLVTTLMMFASLQVSANTQADIDGDLQLKDGSKTVLISIGNGSSSNANETQIRIRRLERAVRDLQRVVYELQNSQYYPPARAEYICSVRTCRKSSSVHAYSQHNCEFFKLYRAETVKVWADSGEAAEKHELPESLRQDGDVAHYIRQSVDCRLR